MNSNPVIKRAAYCLAHVPDLVQHGSKPRREINKDAELAAVLQRSLRPFTSAVSYPPNQVFVGNLTPEQLGEIPRPWFRGTGDAESTRGRFGEIVDQETFYAVLKLSDVLEPPLFEIAAESVDRVRVALSKRPLLAVRDGRTLRSAPSRERSSCSSHPGPPGGDGPILDTARGTPPDRCRTRPAQPMWRRRRSGCGAPGIP